MRNADICFIQKGEKFIHNDFKSVMLYFDYFSPGIKLPKIIDCRINRRFLHIILRILIIISYFLKIYYLKYNVVELNTGSIIILNGKGKWSNNINLIKRGKNLRIIKKVSNSEIFNKEREFYLNYKDNRSKIKLPECKFLEGNIIEIDFLGRKSLEKLANNGIMSFDQSIKYFKLIKKELYLFYENNKENYLIHGDFGPPNIYLGQTKFFLIDYSDCSKSNLKFDLYVLLRGILIVFNKIQQKDSIILSCYPKQEVLKLLETDEEELINIENSFFNMRRKKHPEIYGDLNRL